MTEYFIPTGASETELVEKRSRFLGHVWPVESEGEARARIEEIRKKHYDARHTVCRLFHNSNQNCKTIIINILPIDNKSFIILYQMR